MCEHPGIILANSVHSFEADLGCEDFKTGGGTASLDRSC